MENPSNLYWVCENGDIVFTNRRWDNGDPIRVPAYELRQMLYQLEKKEEERK